MKYIAPLLCAGFLLASCGDNSTDLHGYAEGRFVMLAPDVAGRITRIAAQEGAHAEAGAVIFQIEDATERSAFEAARSSAQAAAARYDDAAAGGREPEVAAARELLKQARAAQIRAQAERERAENLLRTGYASRARVDEAVAAAESADARVAEMRERLTLSALPAREDQLRALAADAKQAEAQALVAGEVFRRRYVTAPAPGRIERIIRFAGDVAAPDRPAVRFLPDGQVRAILFVPEPLLAQTPVGTGLEIFCDGCPANAKARVVRLSEEAEFTPPVIYSDAERARLVFRAEAQFEGFTPPPGTPLRARIAAAEAPR